MYEFADEATLISAGLSFEVAKAAREVIYSLRYVIFAIGEAANHVSEEFRAAHPEVEWARIIGMRNILAHEYHGTKDDIVWNAATVGAAELLQQLKPLIGERRPPN